jgi:AcrR family transcriptional regulator
VSESVARTVTRSRENTRARLMEAAVEVFAEVGLDGASVETICERAGFTRGAFYSNFESKDELFLAMLARLGEEQLADVEARLRELEADGATPADPAELVRRVVGVSLGQHMDPAFMSELRTQALRDPATARAYLLWQDGMVDRIERIVHNLVSTVGFRIRLPERETARLFLQTVDDTCMRAGLEGVPPEELALLVNARIEALAMALVDPPLR